MPQVSVIVPNYNHFSFLTQRLDSIFNQTYQDFEVILLDDCSTDNSVRILKQYANHKKVAHFIGNKTNSGSPYRQWKKGIELARGKYIWIAESDDWAKDTFLKEMINLLERHPSSGIAYCQSYLADRSGNIIRSNYEYTEYLSSTHWKNDYFNEGISEINDYLIYRNTIPNVSAVVFRTTHLVTDNFIAHYNYLGDWYLYCLVLLNSDIVFKAGELNYFRTHGSTVRSSAFSDGTRELEYFQLLSFLTKQPGVSLRAIKSQKVLNYNYWLSKRHSISLTKHRKILRSAIMLEKQLKDQSCPGSNK